MEVVILLIFEQSERGKVTGGPNFGLGDGTALKVIPFGRIWWPRKGPSFVGSSSSLLLLLTWKDA